LVINSPIWGSDPFGPISTKVGTFVSVGDVIIESKFGFNILRGFRSTKGQIFSFDIDFAGHRYNTAAATGQPVMITVHAFILSVDQAAVTSAAAQCM